MRKDRDRGLGFDDAMDAEAIENYYRFDSFTIGPVF